MAVSKRLRMVDVRAVFRLVGECRDLGDDPTAWRNHALAGACRLVGGVAANGGELHWPQRGKVFGITLPTEYGFTDEQHILYAQFMREYGPNDPLILGALRSMVGPVVTRRRTSMIDENIWQRSDFFALYREARQRFDLFSLYDLGPSGHMEAIILHRAEGERNFGHREARLLRLILGELGVLIGTSLAMAEGSPFLRLPPRVRQTLDCLLEGDSEKQVARRLGLSHPTVHQYVTALYRRFGVSGRAELLARFVRRLPPT